MTRMSRWVLSALLAAIALTGTFVGGTAGTVVAHAALQSSTPVANSVLEQGPPQIVLRFDEGIEAGLASITLFDGKVHTIGLGKPVAGSDANSVTASVPELGDGVYAVIWRVTSVDGHVVDGGFSFQIGTGASGDGQALIAEARRGVRAAPAVRFWYGVARFVGYLSVVALLGAGWWIMQGGASLGRLAGRRWRRLPMVAAVLLVLSSVAAFLFFGAEAVAGSLSDAFSPSVWGDVAGTRTGALLLGRVGLAVAWVALVGVYRHLQRGTVAPVAFVIGLCTLYTFSAVGHPNTLHPAPVWIAVDLFHLAAITLWLGGLIAFALLPRTALADAAGAQLAKRFSRWALIAVPVVVVTGGALTWKLNRGLAGITDTDWGREVLIKVALVGVLLAAAGVSRFLLHRRSAASMRYTVWGEALIGLVIVGIAASIVSLPPEQPVRAQSYAEELAAPNGLIALVSLGPGHVGSNEIHINLTPPGGSLAPVAGMTARVALPDGGIPESPVTLKQEGPNHYSGTVTFPRSGQWRLELIVQVTASETQSLKAVVSIP